MESRARTAKVHARFGATLKTNGLRTENKHVDWKTKESIISNGENIDFSENESAQ